MIDLAQLERLAAEAVEASVTSEQHLAASTGSRDDWEAIRRFDRAETEMWDACDPVTVAALVRAVRVLETVEWTGGCKEFECCWCDGIQTKGGHEDYCQVAKALAPFRGQP